MSSFIENTQVFVVRVWYEPRELQDAEPVIRIYIEHVVSGKHHYLTELGEIEQVIRSYFDQEDSG